MAKFLSKLNQFPWKRWRFITTRCTDLTCQILRHLKYYWLSPLPNALYSHVLIAISIFFNLSCIMFHYDRTLSTLTAHTILSSICMDTLMFRIALNHFSVCTCGPLSLCVRIQSALARSFHLFLPLSISHSGLCVSIGRWILMMWIFHSRVNAA